MDKTENKKKGNFGTQSKCLVFFWIQLNCWVREFLGFQKSTNSLIQKRDVKGLYIYNVTKKLRIVTLLPSSQYLYDFAIQKKAVVTTVWPSCSLKVMLVRIWRAPYKRGVEPQMCDIINVWPLSINKIKYCLTDKNNFLNWFSKIMNFFN